jgi:hypothetical protein
MLFLDEMLCTLLSLSAKMQKTTDLSIDYTLIPSNVPAICIPYVFENIGEKRIEGIFKDLELGKVDRIDLVPTQNHAPNGSKVNRVFIHINWKIDETTNKIRTKLLCGKEVKVLYDGTYYWRLSASRAKEVKPHQPKPVQKDMKPRIELDDDSPPPHRGPRGPPSRGPPSRGPPEPRDYRPRSQEPPRDYRPKGEVLPPAPSLSDSLRQEETQFLPPARSLSDFSLVSLKYPEEFVSEIESLKEEDFQPTTPPTPPVKYTRPLADIDFQEKVPDQTYAGVEGKTPPKVTKRKKTPAAKKVEVEATVVEATDVEATDVEA